MKRFDLIVLMLMFLSLIFVPFTEAGQKMSEQDNETKLSLIVPTPEAGFQLAIKLARKGVTETQPDTEVLKKLRPAYAHDPDSLIAASQVIAIHFQTIAAANNYWRNGQ
ncbi:MAG: hexameric tyrosine-coordinated heme protein [Desulfovermiculus sp.]